MWQSGTPALTINRNAAPAAFESRISFLLRSHVVLWCLTGEVKYRDLILPLEPFVQPFDLIVHERVHWVENNCTHARFARSTALAQNCIHQRQQEGLGLSSACGRRYYYSRTFTPN
jgi:hypothetical protein